MANVAGLSQLMETAVHATQTTSASPDPEHSFATAMRQANTDAGVPVAPPEPQAQPKVQAKQSDAGQHADHEGQASVQATQGAQPPLPETGKVLPVAVVAQPSMRYTSANMLSAMATHAGVGADGKTGKTTATGASAPQASFSTGAPLSQAFRNAVALPASSPIVPGAGSSFNDGASVQVAGLDGKPVDLAAPVAGPIVAPSTGSPVSSKSVKSSAKAEAAPSVTKQEPSKASEPAIAPVPAATIPPLSMPTTVASLPAQAATADTNNAIVASVESTLGKPLSGAAPVAGPRLAPATTSSVSAGLPAQTAMGTAQASAATFRQSLAATQIEPATATPANLAGTSPAAERPVATAVNPQPGVATTKTSSAATTMPQPSPATPVAMAVPAAASAAVATLAAPASQPQSTAVLPVPVAASASQSADSSVAHKAPAKPLATDGGSRQAAPAALQTPLPPTTQPAASPTSASSDGKEAPHNSTAPAISPAPALAADSSASVPTAFPVAHTPVAITALGNPSGPFLATAATSVSTSTATAPADTLQHTTLSSTPTTLEVGVASGTHGWLKIRAELNASGTVDASLTGANAAATGRLHTDLPALSSFLQDERVAVGSLNVSAPGAAASALHATLSSTLEPTSSFTRSAAEGVGATGTAVASDASASGGRAPQQQAPENAPTVTVAREDDGVARAIAAPASALYGEANDMAGSGALSEGGYHGGGSWLNVRV